CQAAREHGVHSPVNSGAQIVARSRQAKKRLRVRSWESRVPAASRRRKRPAGQSDDLEGTNDAAGLLAVDLREGGRVRFFWLAEHFWLRHGFKLGAQGGVG